MHGKRIPYVLRILSALAGFAFFMVAAGWMNQFMLLFGAHTVSVVSIVIAGLFCIAGGSNLIGRLADSVNKPAILLSIVLSVIVVFLFLQGFLFNILKEVFSHLSGRYYPRAFGTGVIRFVLTFAYLLIPLSSFGGIWPLFFRLFVKNIDHSGKFMSASVFSFSTGIIFSIILAVFIFPSIGMPLLFLFGAFIFIIILLIVLSWSGNIRKRDYHSPYIAKIEKARKSIRFKKKRIVLEAGVKLTRAMLNGYAFQFFAFFSLLIVSYRILIRYNIIHHGYFIYIFVATVIAGIAIGCLLYKIIAEKPANKFLTLATLQVISGLGCLLSFAFFKIFSGSLFYQIVDIMASSGRVIQQSAFLAIFLLIPCIIQGISVPLAGKLYPRRLPYIGKSFGKLGSLILLSFCSALVMAPFIVIPLFGLQIAFIGLALLILLSGIYLIFRDSRLIRGFRIAYSLTSVLVFIIVAVMFQNQRVWQDKSTMMTYTEGSTVTIISRENDDSTQSVFVDGDYFFGTDKNSRDIQLKSAMIPYFLNPSVQSALVTGFGAGLTANALDAFKLHDIYITEAYPEVIKISSDIFAGSNNDVLTSANVDVSVEDSRSYLFRTQKSYDLITSGIEKYTRFTEEFTEEYYKLCFDKLTENGSLCQVIPLQMISDGFFKSACNSAYLVFGHVSIWYLTPNTLMMMATKKPLNIDYCSVMNSLADSLTNELFPDADRFLSHLILPEDETATFIRNSERNLDGYLFRKNLKEGKNSSDLDFIKKSKKNLSKVITFKGMCSDSSIVINRISRLNQSLLQHLSLSSSWNQPHIVDSSAEPYSPIQQYL